MKKLLALLFACIAVSACANMQEKITGTGVRSFTTQNIPYKKVWASAHDSLKSDGYTLTKENKTEGIIVARGKDGVPVRVTITPVAGQHRMFLIETAAAETKKSDKSCACSVLGAMKNQLK